MSVLMAHVHAHDGPAGRGLRRAHQRGARHPFVGRAAGRRRSPRCSTPAGSSSATSRSPIPAPRRRCCDGISFAAERGADDRDHRQHRRRQDHAAVTRPAAGRRHVRGAVLVDGVDVRVLDPGLLWSRLGYVPQKAYLFSGTVASTLRYGKPDATDARIVGGARDRAGARLRRGAARGLDATVAQGGTNLSGGQRQRLAIARAPRPPPGDLPVRRRVLRARPRHRRSAAGRAAADHPRRRGARRRAAGVDDPGRRPIIVLEAGGSSATAPTTSCCATARPTPRSCRASSAPRRRRMTHSRTSGGHRRTRLSPRPVAGRAARRRTAVDDRRHAGREVDQLRPVGASGCCAGCTRSAAAACWCWSSPSAASR